MREVVTLALDVLGLLLLAAGVGVLLAGYLGPGPGLLAAGAVILGGRWAADRATRPAERPGERL